jgi:hypothetical protein
MAANNGEIGNAPVQGFGNVRFIRAELRRYLNQYRRIKHCIEGEEKIKEKGNLYLPQPDPTNTSAENVERYRQYVERAVFYNATRRTLAGLIGEIYAIMPEVVAPPALDASIADATGGGVSLVQQSVEAAHNVLAYSRCGLLIDYPTTESGATQAQVEDGDIRPVFRVFAPWHILNWRTIVRGSLVILSMVVIEEWVEDHRDTFEVRMIPQWRVLRLDAQGEYVVDIYRSLSGVGATSVSTGEQGVQLGISSTVKPTDANGEPFRELPFKFIGATNNSHLLDPPLLYDLASLNIGHYRNSADYEESSFTVGQPTYWFAGLTKDWVKDVLGNRVETGSRASVALPEKGTAGVLQVAPNSQPFEAMQQKERQMVALGAKLVENKQVQRTATESTMDQRTENSILSTAANNVSDAFTWGLQWACRFVGVEETTSKFQCNTEFAIHKLSPQDQAQLVATWQAGLIDTEEARAGLKKSGIAFKKDEEAQAAIDAEAAKKQKMQIDLINAQGDQQAKKPFPPAKPGGTNPANPAN